MKVRKFDFYKKVDCVCVPGAVEDQPEFTFKCECSEKQIPTRSAQFAAAICSDPSNSVTPEDIAKYVVSVE